jgi:hypothetical protein
MSTSIIRILCIAIAAFFLGGVAILVALEVAPKGFVLDHSTRLAIAGLLAAAYFIYAFIKAGKNIKPRE